MEITAMIAGITGTTIAGMGTDVIEEETATTNRSDSL